jgi:hypothetical protein
MADYSALPSHELKAWMESIKVVDFKPVIEPSHVDSLLQIIHKTTVLEQHAANMAKGLRFIGMARALLQQFDRNMDRLPREFDDDFSWETIEVMALRVLAGESDSMLQSLLEMKPDSSITH